MGWSKRFASGSQLQSIAAWGTLLGIWGLAGIGVMLAQSPSQSPAADTAGALTPASPPGTETIMGNAPAESGESAQLRREGTYLHDERGHFELNGTRVVFISADGKTQFAGLENLNLQRISQTLGGELETINWTVSGLVTEYQGANYLLVTRATKTTSGSGRRRSF